MARQRTPAHDETIHATAVAFEGRGVLVLGPSGAGKSSLALQLMAFGAELVADDRVLLAREDERLTGSAPDAIAGRIEARGIGILNAKPAQACEIVLAVDLSQNEHERLPAFHEAQFLGVSLPCVHNCEGGAFAAGILQYLKTGRAE